MKPLLDLEAPDCKWPIGDPKKADFGFCGERRQPGRPYCAGHCRLAYMPRRAEPWVPGAKKVGAEAVKGGFHDVVRSPETAALDCVEAFAQGGAR